MALFIGTFENKVDGRLRVSLPVDFRDALPDSDEGRFFLFPSPRGDCLEVCDRPLMQRVIESVSVQTDLFSDQEYALSYIPSEERWLQCDATGRFILPSTFVRDTGLTDQVLFAGIGERFQIWAPDRYAEQRQRKRVLARGSHLRLLVGQGMPDVSS